MNRATAVELLPAMHAVAVRLRDSGAPDAVIATALGIDDEQVTTQLGLADAKLANLMAREPG
ncbi:MAG: hypothetical protein ACHQFZ_05525 [Acidimicrobiales bacterium]